MGGMTWTRVGVFRVSPRWQFTEPVEGEFFRIKSTLSATSPSLWSGLICQSPSGFNEPIIYQPQRIWAVENEWTGLQLQRPEILPNRSIGIKRLGDFRTAISWYLTLEVWNPRGLFNPTFPALIFPP
jgi:hypothetical protein